MQIKNGNLKQEENKVNLFYSVHNNSYDYYSLTADSIYLAVESPFLECLFSV